MRVAIVTSRENPHPDPDEPRLLAALGGIAEVRAWDDPSVDWAVYDLAVIRSTWNYVRHHDAFVAWAARVPRLANPADVVRWNAHKGYLFDLERSGIAIVPTTFVRSGEETQIPYDEAVVKPAVGAGSWRTFRARRGDTVVADRDLLVQPYVRAVESSGERALVFIDGELTHAIRKSPFSIDTEIPVVPVADDELAFARRVLAGRDLLYARVDLIRDGETLRLMELELIEPFLFLEKSPAALERLAAGILRRAAARS